MSITNQTSKKSRGAKLASEIGINKEHEKDMESIIKYMEEHRLQELLNEILTRILDERPQDARFHICEFLKNVQKQKQTDPLCQRVYQFQDQKGIQE